MPKSDNYLSTLTFIRPFPNVLWDDSEHTLAGRSDWSSGFDQSTSSGRLLEGTAPVFILRRRIEPGMTEHDAVFNNQIRCLLLEDDYALSAAATDNATVPLGPVSCFVTVETDPFHALEQIEAFAQVAT